MDQFQHLDNLNVHSSCRTCLENLNDMHHNIFAIPAFQEKLAVCTSLPVEPGDGYPTSLCDLCYTKINDFYNFQQMCISARKNFEDYINFEKKTCSMDLPVNPSNLPNEMIMFKKENKGEQEDSLTSYDACLEFVATEMSNNGKSQEDSSEQEESDDDQPIIKYRVSKGDNLLKNHSENEETSDEIKTGGYCEICKKIFKKDETYTTHMRVHQGLKPFACQFCDKTYVKKFLLVDHIKFKHEGKPKEKFPCTEPGCDKILNSRQNFRRHIKDLHSGTPIKPPQPYVCDVCGKVLTSLATFRYHAFMHTGEQRPHECPHCEKRYITKHKLKEHMHIHTGIKKYTCPICGVKKSTYPGLSSHINFHTKKKTYPCQFCEKIFYGFPNISRHTRVVHQGIKDYACSYCDKTFGNGYTRKHHELIHTGEKPYECDICHKTFNQPNALKRHKKIHLKAAAGGEK